MDSAIPAHLRCPRSQPRRVADDYTPPYPAWSASPEEAVEQVVMGYFGVQWRGADRRDQAFVAIAHIISGFAQPDGPVHHDQAHYIDGESYDTLVAIAYWTDRAAFLRWRDQPDIDGWWQATARLDDGIGYFREIVSPRTGGFETLFSAPDRMEGVGVAIGRRTDEEIQEHAYWGAMRERIGRAQTDALLPEGAPARVTQGRRIRISGHDNVALIRSGQDWTETVADERARYLDRMEPTLRVGMDFLRDEGAYIGCYVNRYMRHVDAAGQPIEKTFGLSYWRSLGAMETWAEDHPTHVAIFGTFMEIVTTLTSPPALRLYHEVSVLKADEQDYEYIGCHEATGWLKAVPLTML